MRTDPWRGALVLAGVCGALAFWSCRSAGPAEVEVEVRSVGMDQASQSPVVVLQDKAHQIALPIWIGPAEAQAIAMNLEGIRPPRPMTHDLVKTLLDEVGVEFDRVVIGELKQSTYFALIHLHSGRKGLQIDSRPSDAIALAVRFKKPIFVASTLLQGDATIDLRHVAGADTVSRRGVTVQALSADLAEYFSLPSGQGVLVSGVEDGVTILQRGDVIVSINGAPVTSLADFSDKLAALGAGPADLSVQRGDHRLRVSLAASAG